LDTGVLGYIGIVWPKEHSPEVSHIPPVTPCIFWVCVFSLNYSACNAHLPYCQLWPVRLYTIFPHYLISKKSYWT